MMRIFFMNFFPDLVVEFAPAQLPGLGMLSHLKSKVQAPNSLPAQCLSKARSECSQLPESHGIAKNEADDHHKPMFTAVGRRDGCRPGEEAIHSAEGGVRLI